MPNAIDMTDEDRLRRLLHKLTGHNTDVRRLWQRVSQMPDSMGVPQNTLSSPGSAAYTPVMGPTTTAAPTTSTTTTPAPVISYLYPVWDRLRSDINLSSGSTAYNLLDDRDADWPNHADYISIDESTSGTLGVWLDPLPPFYSVISAEIQLYVKNENSNSPIIAETQIVDTDETTNLTDLASITGIGTSEGSYSLRTATLTLEAEAQDGPRWSRPRLNITIENDHDHRNPKLFISAARVKVTHIPKFY